MRKTTLNTSGKHFIKILPVMLALLTAMSPLAVDTYLSSMPTMADYFNVKINQIEISLTLYFLGFAFGNFLGGPLSDSFGRKTIALVGIVLYGLSAFVIPFSPNIKYVWALRTIQAFGGGFATVTVMVFVRDWFEGKQVAKLATIISMIMMFAPLIAPVLGSGLLHFLGWKSIFIFLGVYALIIFLIYSFLMPESRKKELITKKITSQQLLGNYKIFFANAKAVFMLFAIGFSMAGMFTFITSASFIYQKFFGFNKTIFTVLFSLNVIINVFASFLNTRLLKNKDPENILKVGLLIQLFSGFILFITVKTLNPPWWLVTSSIGLYIGSLGMIFGNGSAIILNLLPEISGSANAAIGVTRFVISFLAGTIQSLFKTDNLFTIGLVLLLCTLISNIFFYFFEVKNKVSPA